MADKIIMSLLVNTAVFSALFCAVLLLKKTAGKKISPFLMLVMWGVVVIKLLIPFGFESSFSILPATAPAQSRPIEYKQPADVIPEIYAETDSIAPADHSINVPAGPAQDAYTAENTEISRPAPAMSVDWTAIALSLWSAGAAIVGTVLCLGAAVLRRRVRHARMETPQHILESAERCKTELGIRRNVSIVFQSAIDKPIIMGAVKPVIVLPEKSGQLEREPLRHVLLHELTHLKGGDLWAVKVMNILRALYWFNPLVWLCLRLIREDIEIACDQSVIKTLGQGHRLSYIGTVLSFAGRGQQAGYAAAMGLFDGRPSMERRIKGMYGKTKTGIRGRIIAVILAALILALSLLTACRPVAENAMSTDRVESRWEYNRDYGTGSSLKIEAAVYSTDTDTLPALTVVPKQIENMENIKAAVNDFCPDAEISKEIKGKDIVLNISAADLLDGITYKTVEGEGGIVTIIVTTDLADSIERSLDFDFSHSYNGEDGPVYYSFASSDINDRLQLPDFLKDDAAFPAAKEKADGLVKAMGIDYMALDSVCAGKGSYRLYYTRIYNGLPETYFEAHTVKTITDIQENAVIVDAQTKAIVAMISSPGDPAQGREYLCIEVKDGGIVKARWNNPSEIKSAADKDSNMLPFERIKEIFLERMDARMASGDANADTYAFPDGTEIVINRVELGLIRLPEEGEKGEYKLVPAWMFMGYQKNKAYHYLNKVPDTGADTCFMTINAIDGTVID